MKLDINLLDNEKLDEYSGEYNNCWNALGLYNSIQFVLRLRPDIREKVNSVTGGIVNPDNYDFDTIQAYSTYFHETIHWWQHIGSISGLILSLSYPSQFHISKDSLEKYIDLTGKIKPIKKYNKLNASEFLPSDNEFKTINIILNNYHDIEYFRRMVVNPELVSDSSKESLFESVGHSFHVAYSSFVNLLASTIDRSYKFIPNEDLWVENFIELQHKKVEGFYHGSSITVCSIGLHEIFEGQARFSQMQFLYFASGQKLTWEDFEKIGMLNGIYYSAFEYFLKVTQSERPASIDSPLVALYLLVLEVAMNPTDGFPFDIVHYESFIESTDPGIRFHFLCLSIRKKYPELKFYIKDYSSQEYYVVSTKLSNAILCHSPLEGAKKIVEWSTTHEPLIKLMEEEKEFKYSLENFPVKLIFSRFIRFQKDKLKNPAFFCWPGVYNAGEKASKEGLEIFDEHQAALFTDDIDGDIYPRTFKDKDDALVQDTFNNFYAWISVYNLSQQWVDGDGEFDYDFFWLTSKYSITELEEWSGNIFHQMYGVFPNEFTII